MKWFEVIIDCGDGSNAVRRYRTLEEANKCIEFESEYGPIPDDPVLVDTDSAGFFDDIEEL